MVAADCFKSERYLLPVSLSILVLWEITMILCQCDAQSLLKTPHRFLNVNWPIDDTEEFPRITGDKPCEEGPRFNLTIHSQ